MRLLKQSDISKAVVFLMVDSSDHISGKTGLSPTVTISKNGGAFASPSGTVSEIGSGWYKLTPASADVDTLGPLLIHAQAAGADPVDLEYQVLAFDPYDSNALGLAYLDASVSSRASAATALANTTWTDARASKLDNLDATVSSRSTLTAADVWSAATRTLTAFGFSVTVGTNNDKTGYSLTAAYDRAKDALMHTEYTAPDNSGITAIKSQTDKLSFAGTGPYDVIATLDGEKVTVQTNEDKTGYSLTTAYDRAKDALSYTEYAAPPSAGTVADAVWDELVSEHQTVGTAGYYLANAGGGASPQVIAAAVWDETRSAHTTAGTFGAVSEWAGGDGDVQVVVQPAAVAPMRLHGDGGHWTQFATRRIVMAWKLYGVALMGHDIRVLIYSASQPSVPAAELRGSEIAIQDDDDGAIIRVNGLDAHTPAAGGYRFIVSDETADIVLLSGTLTVVDAPEGSP